MTLPFKVTEPQSGIYIVDKPLGLPSTVIVDFFKYAYEQKTGHGGTLDPMATGKLVILTGTNTKKSQDFLDHEKGYSFSILLGAKSESADIEKPFEIIGTKLTQNDEARIREALTSLPGKHMQVVPRYSAVKTNGRPLYKKLNTASSDLPVREVEIFEVDTKAIQYISTADLTLILEEKITTTEKSYEEASKAFTEINKFLGGKYLLVKDKIIDNLKSQIIVLQKQNEHFIIVSMAMRVSKGTYIRSIATQIGDLLGESALVLTLERTAV